MNQIGGSIPNFISERQMPKQLAEVSLSRLELDEMLIYACRGSRRCWSIWLLVVKASLGGSPS